MKKVFVIQSPALAVSTASAALHRNAHAEWSQIRITSELTPVNHQACPS